MNTVHGNTQGLKASQLDALKRLYRRRVPPSEVVTAELARTLCELSRELGRQIAVLIDRKGDVRFVILGNDRRIQFPDLSAHRVGHRRLRGLRCVHTHLREEPLNDDDLTDLAGLRLDLMAAIGVGPDGLPRRIHMAHVQPGADTGGPNRLPPVDVHHNDLVFDVFIDELEARLSRAPSGRDVKDPRERAILVSVSTETRDQAEDSLAELAALAHANELLVVDQVLQRPRRIDPRYLMGRGKLEELTVRAMQLEADVILFDQELSPSQMEAVAAATELKVIDRTQLILDIFARRAHSADGKVQVELAQQRYRLPRLGARQSALSRLTGGIGGRGPGETRLEIDLRRARDRIRRLEKQLDGLARGRAERRKRRLGRDVPIVSVVGYTNAGKSTLLNALTQSDTVAEDRLFATLDTATRRLRFPAEREILITDTVGFIRRLPPDLVKAFQATLDELADADLLLHVVDISHPQFEEQIRAVNIILTDLGLAHIPQLMVLNKVDRVDVDTAWALCRRFEAVAVSAIDRGTFPPLMHALEARLWGMGHDVGGIGGDPWPES
ncbi:MAG: GTPase HflX [Nitrospirae bacterium]|nr:GTPase HflX [Nitrospirota bacterium]